MYYPLAYYFDWTWGLLLAGIVVTMIAQIKVSSTYRKYEKIRSRRGLTGYDTARLILDYNGLQHVQIERVRGHLSDHYDPRHKVLRLSETTFTGSSVAALGVAAHEVGHAIQDDVGYAPLKIRTALVPLANFGSQAAWILVIIGFLFSFTGLIDLGILFFSLAVVFQLVTLPVEFNASSRALAALEGGEILDVAEVQQTKKVLSAAALTYVAAAFTAILQLIRLILIRNSRN